MLEYQKPHSFVAPRRRMISRFGSSSEVSMVALLHKKQQGYPNHDGFVHSLTSIANKSRSKWDSHRSDLTRLSYLNGGLVPYIYSTWGSHKITVVQPTQITVWEPAQSVSTRLISLISRKLHETLDVPDSLFWRNVKHVPSRNMSQPSVNGRNCLYDWVSPARYVLYRFVQWSIGQHPRLFFLGCIGVSYLLWACAAFCWSKSYYQTNIMIQCTLGRVPNTIASFRSLSNMGWVPIQTSFKGKMTRWWCSRIRVRGAGGKTEKLQLVSSTAEKLVFT